MKCVITGVNIKVFARAVHSLAKLGEELYVEPNAQGVCFRTVNSTRSAFATFQFSASFFSSFDGSPPPQPVAGGEGSSSTSLSPKHKARSEDEQNTIKCKVAMKAFLSAFKSLHSVEKTVERCRITLDGGAAKLQLQMWCRHSVVRTYNLAFIECETLKAVFDEASCVHRVTSQSRLLSDAFANFQAGQDEVSFSVTPSAIIVRNYVDDEPDLSRVIRTELHLQDLEFDEYQITSDCEVVFCLKELRALLGFSEPVHLPVTALFSQPGSPIIFTVENQPLYECKFVLATLISTPGDTQTTAAGAVRVVNPVTDDVAATQPSAAGSRGSKRAKRRDDQHHTITHHDDDAAAAGLIHDSSVVDVLRGEASGVEAGGGKDGEEAISVSNRCVESSNVSLDVSRINSRHINGKALNRLSHMPVHPRNNIDQRTYNNLSGVPEQPFRDTPSMQRLQSNISKSCNNEVILSDGEEIELEEICRNNNNGLHDATTNNHDRNELEGTPSPPTKRKRAHFLFRRCFNATFDPMTMPGCDVVLAKDSDSEDD